MPRAMSNWMEALESRMCFSAELSGSDPDLQQLMIDHEGEVLYVYPDTMGNPTVGVGVNLNVRGARALFESGALDYDAAKRTWEITVQQWLRSGHSLSDLKTNAANHRAWQQFIRLHPPAKALTPEQSRKLLELVLEQTIADAHRIVPDFDELGHDPQTAVVDMIYNLGPAGFSKFRRLVADLDHRDFGGAAQEMKNSKWAGQVGSKRVGDDVRRMHAGDDSPTDKGKVSRAGQSAPGEGRGKADTTGRDASAGTARSAPASVPSPVS